MTEVLAGEVQQYRGGRWRVVLTAAGIPVDDRRRRSYHDSPMAYDIQDEVLADWMRHFTERRPTGQGRAVDIQPDLSEWIRQHYPDPGR